MTIEHAICNFQSYLFVSNNGNKTPNEIMIHFRYVLKEKYGIEGIEKETGKNKIEYHIIDMEKAILLNMEWG